uniref:Uncharacterized protein n=1 Tax=Setaria italica TaxID=4555 RepID=K3ZBG4_SETIT
MKYQCFLHPNNARVKHDCSIFSTSLPVTIWSGAVCSRPIRIFLVTRTKEEPLKIFASKRGLVCAQRKISAQT